MTALKICPSMAEFEALKSDYEAYAAKLRPAYFSAYTFPLNRPSGAGQFGAVFRSAYDPPRDSYYIYIDSAGRRFTGRQENGAASITWRTIAS